MRRSIVVLGFLAASGCAGAPIPYVSLSGTIALPVADNFDLNGAPIAIVSLTGNLANSMATTARQAIAATATQPAQGVYSLEIDARTLPAVPTVFTVQLDNPEPPPRDGPLLEGPVVLSRPSGKGPALGRFTANLDATSSLAAMAIEYRQGLSSGLATASLDPAAIATYLGAKTSLPFDLATAYIAFRGDQSDTAPCASPAIAQQANQALPVDLSTMH